MAGRAGLGLAQGFMQGYEFMDTMDKRERRMGLQEAQAGRAAESHRWQAETMDQKRNQWEREDDGRLVQAMQQGIQSGSIDPEIADEYGRRFDVDWSNYVDPEFGQSLQTLEQTVGGEISMKDPEFNRAFERVFRTEINKGTGEEYEGADGAHRLEQKRLAGVYPGPDGKSLMVDLDVLDKGPNGEEWRRAPVTTNRSAKDDEVRAIPLEDALKKLKGHQLMYKSVQSSPELQGLIRQHAARTGTKLPEAKTSEAYRKRQELAALGIGGEKATNAAYGIKPDDEGRHGQPFQHPQLGWVQSGPDGQLKQLDSAETGDGDWRKLNDGSLFNRRTGETMAAGGEAPNDGTGGLDSSVMSQIQQTARNFHGSFNPDGSFMGIPAGAREKYTMAMERAQELISKGGMSVFEATNLANLSVSEQLSESDARRLAEQEAEQEVTGWFKGDEKDAFVKRRTQELLNESRTAQQRYEQIVGGSGQKASPANPAEPDMQQANQIKADYRAGKISREQAAAKLRSLGFQ